MSHSEAFSELASQDKDTVCLGCSNQTLILLLWRRLTQHSQVEVI